MKTPLVYGWVDHNHDSTYIQYCLSKGKHRLHDLFIKLPFWGDQQPRTQKGILFK